MGQMANSVTRMRKSPPEGKTEDKLRLTVYLRSGVTIYGRIVKADTYELVINGSMSRASSSTDRDFWLNYDAIDAILPTWL